MTVRLQAMLHIHFFLLPLSRTLTHSPVHTSTSTALLLAQRGQRRFPAMWRSPCIQMMPDIPRITENICAIP